MAIGFKQGEFIYMESLAYTIVQKTLKLFKEDGIYESWVNQIKVLKNQKPPVLG